MCKINLRHDNAVHSKVKVFFSKYAYNIFIFTLQSYRILWSIIWETLTYILTFPVSFYIMCITHSGLPIFV